MAHRVVLDVLYAEAQRYIAAVQRETDPEKMRKLAVTASGLSQLFEQVDRGIALTSTDVAAYRETLGHVEDAKLRAAINTLLDPKVNSAAS
jgi:hypothetical protein